MRANTDLSLKLEFDKDAQLYDRARPHYPLEVFNAIARLADLSIHSKVLEVGCGSGQATHDLGIRGYEVTALEPGPNLADIARKNCEDLENVAIINAFFEEWDGKKAFYDAIISANAWHWIDLDISYTKAASLLKEGGFLSVFWNFPKIDDPLVSKEIEAIVTKEAPGANGLACYNGMMTYVEKSLADGLLEFENSRMFGKVITEKFTEKLVMSSQAFVDWVGSYSNIQNLKPDVRARLNMNLSEFIDATKDRAVTMSNEIVLRVAPKLTL